jgi:membrane protein
MAYVVPFQEVIMNSVKARLEAFQRSRAGLFVKKLLDDQAPNLAALLAWGTLSAMLPLVLGVLSLAGLILRDPQRLDTIYNTLLALVPSGAAGPLSDALTSVREAAAAPAGILALLLLLFNGSSFFANMGSVFDQAYHVESRNFAMQRLIAICMLAITSALLIVSTVAQGIGSIISSVPTLGLPIGPALVTFIGYSIAIVSAFVLFLLLYKVLPNAQQGWRDVIPGTLTSSVLFLVITQIFPIYLKLFPPNQAYAVFGVFLVLTFWLYLLGFVFVLGAELNAFLQDPARSTALAEATKAAAHGKANYEQPAGEVRAEAVGSAPAMTGGGVLGSPERSSGKQLRDQNEGQAPSGSERGEGSGQAPGLPRPSLAGRLLGFVGLLVAVLLLRGRNDTQNVSTESFVSSK